MRVQLADQFTECRYVQVTGSVPYLISAICRDLVAAGMAAD